MSWQGFKNYVAYKIGHRGSFLFLLALAFTFYGIGVIKQNAAYDIYPYRYISWDEWGYVWIATGITAFVGAFRRHDRISFTVATIISALWTVRWVSVSFMDRNASIWSTALTWLVITGIIVIISTWPEVHIEFKQDGPDPPRLDHYSRE